MLSRSLSISRIIFIVAASAAIIFSNDFSSVAHAFTLAPPPSAAKTVTINKEKNKRKKIQVNHHSNFVDPFTIQPTQSFEATTSRPVAFRRRRIGRSARRLGRRTCVVAYARTKIEAIDTQHTVIPSSVECPL